MNCEFSETQFSFCFTFELVRRYLPRIILPIFPNTVVEGRPGGGYDVQIDGSLFFQFKIPQYFERSTWSRPKGWSHFKKPFLRIDVDTDSEQFRLLHALKLPANNVYYATPEFSDSTSLENFYRLGETCDHSALFAIQNFPMPINGYHHLGYTGDDTFGILFSEPKIIKKSSSEEIFSIFPDQMSLARKASILRNVIFESNKILIEEGVQSVFSVLLTRFNILWIPIFSNFAEPDAI
jgi:hypothetical protein